MPGGSGLITIIILIAVVWQIISMIIAHAQQQKQRQAEAEARRQQLLSGGGQRGGGRSTPAALAGGDRGQGQPKLSKLDELAARRQQQLEELRRRRESGRQPASASTSTSAQGRTGTTSTSEWESGAQLRTGQPTKSGLGLPIDVEPRRVPSTQPSRRISPGQKQQMLQEQQRLARQNQQQQQQQARLRRAEDLARQQRVEIDREISPYAAGEIGVAETRRSEREAYGIAVPVAPDEPVHLGRVQQLLHNRATLRELIVMKEVLDQPVSLREPRWV